ncbi:MAG: DUF4357 domain-containing protein [Anaerolineae bacterium]|nr:DUF4357 domain-containing protein [Anaerolineae bacterium]
MPQKHSSTNQDTHASDLNLQIAFHASEPNIKTYLLHPQIGLVECYGVDKKNRKSFHKIVDLLGYGTRDCVYILFDQMSINYVGMTQNIKQRLDQHASQRKNNKNWDRVLAFYLKNPIHNTSIVAFVERTLYVRLTDRGFQLNQAVPDGRVLNPDDQKIAQRFVTEVERILSLLDMAEPIPSSRKYAVAASTDDVKEDVKFLEELRASKQPSIEVELNYAGTQAVGKYSGYGLEVYGGSIGTSHVQNHMQDNQAFWRTRNELIEAGVIEIVGEILRFTQNYTFSSPTAAAQILTGSNRPGPLVWRRATDKKTLKEINP